ncbi:hypothetical protein V9516_002440 [Vibrio parahaemolyticus]
MFKSLFSKKNTSKLTLQDVLDDPLKCLKSRNGTIWYKTKKIGGGMPHNQGETCDVFDDLYIGTGKNIFAYIHNFSICPETKIAVIKHFALEPIYTRNGLGLKIISELGKELKNKHSVDKIQFHTSIEKTNFNKFYSKKLKAKAIDVDGRVWEWKIK